MPPGNNLTTSGEKIVNRYKMLPRTSFFVLLTVAMYPMQHQDAPRRTTSLHRSVP
jgi:hypothetical protein